MPNFKDAIESIGQVVDLVGVLAIIVGAAVAALRIVPWHARPSPAASRYLAFRQDLGRAILLGLEFLVAADIIRTVAVAPTLEGVLVLALVVLVRTMLSFSLQVELEGRWPWARARGPDPETRAP
jgi:uncharacterized membrane protein